MVEQKLPKLTTRVRFPSPAPLLKKPQKSDSSIKEARQALREVRLLLDQT
jgi:hypothetical protein